MLSDVEELLDVVENIHSSVMLLFSSAWQEWQGVTSDTHVAVEETERESEDQTRQWAVFVHYMHLYHGIKLL